MNTFKKTILYGMIGGVIWGLLLFISKALIEGISSFESSLINSLITFCCGGSILGFIIGGFMYIRLKKNGGFIFKNLILDASLITVILWGILYAGGALHALTDPLRYHIELSGAIKGIMSSALLGGTIGVICKLKRLEE